MTRRYLDVDSTSFKRFGHQMDVQMTLCAARKFVSLRKSFQVVSTLFKWYDGRQIGVKHNISYNCTDFALESGLRGPMDQFLKSGPIFYFFSLYLLRRAVYVNLNFVVFMNGISQSSIFLRLIDSASSSHRTFGELDFF